MSMRQNRPPFERRFFASRCKSRGVIAATIAAVAVTMFEPQAVLARDKMPSPKMSSQPANAAPVETLSGATDFSAARRYRRHYNNNAAAAAAFGAFAGIVGGVIANQQRRDYYRDRYYYGGGPYYGPGYGYGYGPGYGYYGGPRYYGGW